MAMKMQEIGFQLMKPPRELASWNFPLSKILEGYSELLPEAAKIHYGEAALVIQNSVNAYVRRLEELYDETKCLNKKLYNGEGNKKRDSFFESENEQNILIDFQEFKLFDFENEIRKNLDLKHTKLKAQNFLHNCFSQLENSNQKLQISLHDIQGESIGKKYEFRSNQKISRFGSLVDEFNLEDYENNYSLVYHFAEIKSKPDMRSDLLESSINFGIADESTNHHNNSLSSTEYTALNPPSASNECKVIDVSSISTIMQCSNTDQRRNIVDVNLQKIPNDVGLQKCSVHVANHDNLSSHAKNLQDESSEKVDLKQNSKTRRSGRIESSTFNLSDTDTLQPISFTTGIPDKIGKSRAKFRFPCNRKLLIGNLKLKNKRNHVNKKKNMKIINTDDRSNETEDTDLILKKIPYGIILSKGHLESFHTFDEESLCLNENCTIQFDPVTTVKMDLLGFEKANRKYVGFCEQYSPLSHINNVISSSENSMRNVTPSSSLFLNLCFSHNSNIRDQVSHNLQKRSIDTVIKNKIKAIYKDLDVLTDEDKKIAEWHEEIKPKLKEAERKPPFNIHEYESRIVKKLEKSNRRLEFNDIVREESFCEIARFFSATLQLASTNNLNINPGRDVHEGIELVLLD